MILFAINPVQLYKPPKYDDDDPKERMLPWEIDARMNAETMYVEYNRYTAISGEF